LHFWEDVEDLVGGSAPPEIQKPTITGIGAGTTYPDSKPAPYIASSKVGGVDVITSVSEAVLSYSGVKVKVDTERNVGGELSPVYFEKKLVGHVCTEEYGSKMLSIGGVNLLTGPNGITVAKCIVKIANKEKVRFKVKDGANLELQVGEAPIINGEPGGRMRIGCGSAVAGLFAPYIKQAADEVIVIDSHITSLFSEHPAGQFVGARPSGVRVKFRRSTPGRYFGEHGSGWGGTPIERPEDIIESIDMDVASPGMTILILEPSAERAAMFQLSREGRLVAIPLSSKAQDLLNIIYENREPSRVSALYTGGVGGSARAGVATFPIKLTRYVHENKAALTVGGAPTFLLPGGGLNFMVDAGKVKAGAFSWVPTPATIAPFEVTMKLEDYLAIGGHKGSIKTLKELRQYFGKGK
jgi:hypothetical protein